MNESDWLIVISALLAGSEALSLIPWVKSNSLLQLIFNIIRRLAQKG